MGAIVPARVEFTPDIFPRCDLIAVDSVAGVKELSAEFRRQFAEMFARVFAGDGGDFRREQIHDRTILVR